jgi:hypothetical protein
LAIAPDDGRIYVGGSAGVYALSPDSLLVLDSASFTSHVRGIVLNEAGDSLYACTDAGVGLVLTPRCSLAAFNAEVTITTKPALSDDERLLYVTSGLDDGVAVLNAGDLSIVRRISLHQDGIGELNISPDGAHLYVDMPVGIYTLDTRTMEPVDSVALDEMWGTILPHPNGDSLYYVGGRSIWVISKRQ